MKTHGINRILVLFFLMAGWITVQGQSQIEVPGDNFSLEGALELFKKSASPEEFERMLNDPESRVNNLDLNGDGYIDYIRVIDVNEGNVHAFIMQAVVSKKESQDVAVITLEKLANGKAVLQITGDEDIYGIETIIEPTREVRMNAGATSSRMVVNVWGWPSVRYIYGPHYSVWISPWGWGYRPHWWHTWRPVVYYDYYSYWRPYRHYYSPCYTHRVVYAHYIYRPHRSTSVIVHERHNRQIAHYRSTRIDNDGRYRYDSDRSKSRQTNKAVRYDNNGRIRSTTDVSSSSRSSSNTRAQQRGSMDNDRSSIKQITRPSSEQRTNSSQQKTSAPRKIETSENRSGAASRNKIETRTPERLNKEGSTGRSNTNRYNNGSSVTPGSKRSYSGTGSNQRSSSSQTIKRSQGRSSGSANVQRSTGSSSKQRSSGSSNVKRSSGNSSSNVRQSSGSSRVQQSSKSPSSVQRSSRSSSGVNRSSGSSGKSSGSSSSTQRSSSSNSKSRGRQ